MTTLLLDLLESKIRYINSKMDGRKTQHLLLDTDSSV